MNPPNPSPEPANPPPPSRGPGLGRWIFYGVLLIVASLLLTLYLIFRKADHYVTQATTTVENVARTAARIFDATKVVETFHEWRELTITAGTGSHLEIATAEATERFTRTTNYQIKGWKLPLSTSISEISVPATYRYHIDLNDEWQLIPQGHRLLVKAPQVRATLPVAFDTGKMQKKTEAGWARWDASADLAELEQGLTEELARRATRPETIARIEDESRLAVARFVRTWLLTQEAWGEGRFEEITVLFTNEEETPGVLPQSLRWQADTNTSLP